CQYKKTPLGNIWGKPTGPSSNCFGSPPDAGISNKPLPGSKKTIVPSSDHEPDMTEVRFLLNMGVGAPPLTLTRYKPSIVKYAIDLLSGDQNGRCGINTPSTLWATPTP